MLWFHKHDGDINHNIGQCFKPFLPSTASLLMRAVSVHLCVLTQPFFLCDWAWASARQSYLLLSSPPRIWSFSFVFWIRFCKLLFLPLSEKAMTPHSSTLAWEIPWTEEHGRLQSMGSLRVRHDWATSLSLFTFLHWRRKWQPIPVFLPGESQGRRSLVGCCLWGHTELDMTEMT